ncbi:hypothetical protein [Agrobacterium sp. NPDC089420]
MRIVESAADANYPDGSCEVASGASAALRVLYCRTPGKALSAGNAA